MSWASHNPEAYDEILKAGIANKLEKEAAENGFEDLDRDTITALVESIYQAKDGSVYTALISWSQGFWIP